ncbi:mitochondrial import inner membrane translocase subunit Tim29 isoform X2 [Latimeria chalumnae]
MWLKSLLHDYKEACVDIVVGTKERPGRAAAYVSLLAGAGFCGYKTPCEASFESILLEASNTLLLLSPWIRNGQSDSHVQRLAKLRNQGRLMYRSLVLFSLIYEEPYDPECDIYEARCEYLRPRLSEFPQRVLDVGFLGYWWVLRHKMNNFDINEEEFKYLPPHLKTISSKDLHSEKNEILFDEKYKPVVFTERQIQQMES